MIRSYLEGNENVMKKHKYMFDEKLETILNRNERKKQYWILTITENR